MRRIGIFGGTFDPIHQAHLDAAAAAMLQAHLDKVLFVVSAVPPHKQDEDITPAPDRAAMVAAALAGHPHFECSTIELDRSGPSYTADTLRELHARFPDCELFLIIGCDALLDLPRWRRPEEIFELAHILVVPRPGFDPQVPREHAERIQFLDFDESRLSSTVIRERLESGTAANGDLPPGVHEVIKSRGLYARA